MKTIIKTVRALGINATYLGYHYLTDAVEMVSKDETLLTMLCSELYPAIAKKHKTTADNVERNIRTAINACWDRGDRAFLDSLFPYHLTKKPCVGELIDALTAYCRRFDSNDTR